MSGRALFHSVIPDNNIDAGYSEFDVVDFTLSFPGRMVSLNNIRISGTLQVSDENGDDVQVQHVQFDQLVGAHALFSAFQTQVMGQTIDNIFEYPRLVKMITSASENGADMNMGSNVCELKAPCPSVAEEMLRHEKVPIQHTVNVQREGDFSIKPVFALNQVYGDRAFLSYSKSGDVRITATLNRNNSALFGISVVDGYSYNIGELRCEFMSYPDDGDMSPVLHKNRQILKQSLESGTAQLNFNYPMVASTVYGSFLLQANENDPPSNNQALMKPPAVEELMFFWNNTTNEYVSYVMRSQAEIIDYAIDAVGTTGRNSASVYKLAQNNGYLCGVRMDEMIDLSRTKISMVLNSSINNTTPFLFYLCAEGVGEI